MKCGRRQTFRSIPKAIRTKVWVSAFGENWYGECKVCHHLIKVDTFEVGHVVARANGGSDNPRNLRPICRPCNTSMGTTNMDAYIVRFYPPIQLEHLIPQVNGLGDDDLDKLEAYIHQIKKDRNDEHVVYETASEGEDDIEEIVPTPCAYIRNGTRCRTPVIDGQSFCSCCRKRVDAINQLCPE
jgi:hypothetical protein